MFNEDDFEKLRKEEEGVPDGVIDASDYLDLMKEVTDILSNLDYEDSTSRMTAMMEIVNLIYNEDGEIDQNDTIGTLISLSFHIISILRNLEDEDRISYFDYTKEDVISNLEEDVKILPYWEVEETEDE